MDTIVPSLGRDHSEDTSCEPTLSSESKEEFDVFGEPEVLPRVGEEYQVLLPEPVSRSEYVKRLRSEVMDQEVAIDILSGLPLSVMWVESRPGCHIREPVDSEEKVSSAVEEKGNNSSGSIPVPGSSYEPLSETEEEIFLLGLYIFGRDFVQVKKFVGSKISGEILAYYYGKFYRSERYWQVSKMFSEGKVLLEEYVMTVKDIVGLNNLVEAVGIGKGKQDLTRLTSEKPNRAAHVQPRWSTRKACSALSSEEILNFLRGGARLSKARTNDLFWEAVWPRLLAKGWHSEEPKKGLFSKDYLVFLVPGVKKFSRRKLMKGEHYFDCVRDVMNKVASEPRILDLGESSEINRVEEGNSDREKSPNRDHRTYLKPRTQSHAGKEDVKFTIIDTTVAGGARRLREMRALPAVPNFVLFGSHLMGDERNSIEVETNAQDPSGESKYLGFNMVEADIFNPVQIISFEKKESPTNNKVVNDSLNGLVQSNSQEFNDNEGKPAITCQQKPRKKPDEKNCLAPEARKRRKRKFSSDNQMGSCSPVGKEMKTEREKEETNPHSGIDIIENGNMAFAGENETNRKPRFSMLIDSLNEAFQSDRQGFNDNEGKNATECQPVPRKKPDEKNRLAPEARKRRKMKISSDNQMGSCSTFGKEMKIERVKEETDSCSGTNITENGSTVVVGENETDHKARPSMLFDLNWPPVMPDSVMIEAGNVGMPMEQHNQLSQQDSVPVAANANPHPIPSNSELQPSTNSRRQSGRKRCMSTKAVEALASGLMAMEARQKR
ncbi:hypothetical protein CRG98_024016 [Punica granatum]|uniref:SANT domain-containing protein n=1 Tax=Punica granatum TaxID=22663 RepID=A0A2I0JH50_PUNGR|nr:hypothetical protein CRG98_024016 [Punica granatum]